MKKEKLDIIYEDKYLIIVNKKSGMLTISTDKEKINTLYHRVREYLQRQNKNNKVFIIHRLDKDTSGLIIFAKSEKIKGIMQDNWTNVKREYLAVVNGNVKNDKGVIKTYLKETKTNLVYSTNNKNGKLAITEYEKIKSNKLYTLLKINLLTGRKNQIRVHLNDIGYPIVGDKKYSKIKNKVKYLYLHANHLEFNHPITNEFIDITIPKPKYFEELIK